MKHNPTRQEHEMYDSLNRKGASHATPHKDLNAGAPAELNRHPNVYSQVHGKMNAKSPIQIHQVEGFKSTHGNLEARPMTSNTLGQTDGDFPSKQMPNTSPKEPHTSATGHPIRTMHHSSKSLIFHG